MKKIQHWLLAALFVLAPKAAHAQVRLSTLPRITSTSGLADSSLFLCNDSTNTRTSACTFFSIRKRLQTTKWDSLSLKRIHPDSIFGAPVWMSAQSFATGQRVDSATGAARSQKLTTARTIFGQSFDGTANASGALSASTGSFSGIVGTGLDFQIVNSGFGILSPNATRILAVTNAGAAFAGTLGVTGTLTASTRVLFDVNQAAFVAGSLYKNATNGLTIGGVTGATNDLLITNNAGAAVLQVPTGTVNATLAGATTLIGVPVRVGANASTNRELNVGGVTDAIIGITRQSNTNVSGLEFLTGTTQDFVIGTRSTSDSHFHIFSAGLAADALTINRTTGAAVFVSAITGTRHVGGTDVTSAVAKGTFSDGTVLDAGTGSATISGVLSTATLASNAGTQNVGTFEGKQTAASTGTADVLTGTGWAAHTSGTLAGSIGVHGSGRFDGSGGTTIFADMVRGGNFLVGAGHTVTTLRSLYANTGANAGTIGTQIGLEVANIALGGTNFSIKTGTGAVSFGDSLNVTGLARFSNGVAGTATNDNAAAGIVGEYMSHVTASGASVGMSSATTTTVDSLSLTAGDWDVTGVLDFVFGTTTSFSDITGGFSTTRSVLGVQDSGFGFSQAPSVPSAAFTQAWNLPLVRFSVSSTTKVYLVVQGTFTVSTLGAYGTIRARRVR